MSLHTVTDTLRLATDQQTLIRSFSYAREGDATLPREEVLMLLEFPDRPIGGEDLASAIFRTLKELCFMEPAADPFERLEMSLKEVNAVIAETREQLPNKHLGRINAIIALISHTDIHLTQTGDAEAYLLRGTTFTTITEGLAPDSGAVDTFINIASGRLENKDKILFSTERLLRYATKNELLKIFSPHKQIKLALEELDEIIVLEGAQTTGIFALDIVTEAVATRQNTSSGFSLPIDMPEHVTKHLQTASKHMTRGLTWLRERIPENLPALGGKLPGRPTLPFDKNMLILGFLGVILLIIISITISLSQSDGKSNAEITATLTTIQEDIDTAKLRRNIGDKATATAELTDAEKLSQTLITAGVAMDEANAKLDEIHGIRDDLNNIKRYADIKPSVDFSANNPSISLQGLIDYHGRKVAFDNQNAYETVGTSVDKSATVDQNAKLKAVTYFADRDSLAFYSGGGQIIEYRDGTATPMHTTDNTWKTGVDLDTYATFLYLLDPVNNQIWRYGRKQDGYGAASSWSKNADLTKAVSLAIDGDVWVLVNSGTGNMENDIIRLRKGEKKPLRIKDLPTDAWQNPTKIFTNENLKNIYVLDPVNKRILKFYKDPPDPSAENKQLQFAGEYLFASLTDIRDFWVDPTEQKLYVIDGSKLYEAAM